MSHRSFARIRRAAFTLLEVMVVFAILAVVGGLLVFVVRSAASGDSVEEDAKGEVQRYAADMNYKVDGVSCGNITNSKGMVYCTLRSGSKTYPLARIGRYKVGHGCHEQMLSGPQGAAEQQ